MTVVRIEQSDQLSQSVWHRAQGNVSRRVQLQAELPMAQPRAYRVRANGRSSGEDDGPVRIRENQDTMIKKLVHLLSILQTSL